MSILESRGHARRYSQGKRDKRVWVHGDGAERGQSSTVKPRNASMVGFGLRRPATGGRGWLRHQRCYHSNRLSCFTQYSAKVVANALSIGLDGVSMPPPDQALFEKCLAELSCRHAWWYHSSEGEEERAGSRRTRSTMTVQTLPSPQTKVDLLHPHKRKYAVVMQRVLRERHRSLAKT